MVKRINGTVAERFWPKVDRSHGWAECWPWLGSVGKNGYGEFGIGGHSRWAHRVAYALAVGPISPGLHLDHECHNRDLTCSGGDSCLHRRCVNPAHLYPRTIRENLRRGFYGRKTHCPRGHEYTPENTYRAPSAPNKRRCRECARILDANRGPRHRPT